MIKQQYSEDPIIDVQKVLYDFSDHNILIKDALKQSGALKVDNNNTIYIANQPFIYIFSLNKINKCMNSIKQKLDIKNLVTQYQETHNNPQYIDKFTNYFNQKTNDLQKNTEFFQSLTLISSKIQEPLCLKNRIKYLNQTSIKIQAFQITNQNFINYQYPILAVLTSIGELYLIGKQKTNMISQYSILDCMNKHIQLLQKKQEVTFFIKFVQIQAFTFGTLNHNNEEYLIVFAESQIFIWSIQKQKTLSLTFQMSYLTQIDQVRQILLIDQCTYQTQETHIIFLHNKNQMTVFDFYLSQKKCQYLSKKEIANQFSYIELISQITPQEKSKKCTCSFVLSRNQDMYSVCINNQSITHFSSFQDINKINEVQQSSMQTVVASSFGLLQIMENDRKKTYKFKNLYSMFGMQCTKLANLVIMCGLYNFTHQKENNILIFSPYSFSIDTLFKHLCTQLLRSIKCIKNIYVPVTSVQSEDLKLLVKSDKYLYQKLLGLTLILYNDDSLKSQNLTKWYLSLGQTKQSMVIFLNDLCPDKQKQDYMLERLLFHLLLGQSIIDFSPQTILTSIQQKQQIIFKQHYPHLAGNNDICKICKVQLNGSKTCTSGHTFMHCGLSNQNLHDEKVIYCRSCKQTYIDFWEKDQCLLLKDYICPLCMNQCSFISS